MIYRVHTVELVERLYKVEAEDEVEAEEKVCGGAHVPFTEGNANIEDVLSVEAEEE